MKDEPIPSPFWGPTAQFDTELLADLEAMFKKHGYQQFVVMCTKDSPRSEDASWQGQSNILSEGLVDYMRQAADWMEEFLNDNVEDSPL